MTSTSLPADCIVLDTETTGFRFSEGHRVVEIGALRMKNGLPTKDTFHVYINPNRTIPANATKVHGITNQDVADKPLFAGIAQSFLDFVGDMPLVAHNAPFDREFLDEELQAAGFPATQNPWHDTVAVARKMFPGAQANLDALCRRFSISLSNRSLHGAMIDTHLLAEVVVELNGGRQQSMATLFGNTQDKTVSVAPTMPAVPRVTSQLDTEAIAAHKRFVQDTLGPNSVWEAYYNAAQNQGAQADAS